MALIAEIVNNYLIISKHKIVEGILDKINFEFKFDTVVHVAKKKIFTGIGIAPCDNFICALDSDNYLKSLGQNSSFF